MVLKKREKLHNSANVKMRFDIITIFPEIFASYFNESIIKKAQEKGLLQIVCHNLRDYTKDKHKKVDDTVFGGGAGMLMTPQPLYDCITAVKKKNKGPIVFFTPQGETFTQPRAEKLVTRSKEYILVCGRYEGIDQRIRDLLIEIEISMGRFVLTGGELPAMTFIDCLTRLIPGALGKDESHERDSYSKEFGRKKEHPQYTRPAEFKGLKVPDILMSGNHAKIEKWRKDNLK